MNAAGGGAAQGPWPRRAFVALWATVGLVILDESVSTVIHAYGPNVPEADHLHMVLLGSIEALGALLFLVPPAMRVGGALMLLTFATAFLVHAAKGGPNWSLLIFAAATAYVMVMGPAAHRGSPGGADASRDAGSG